MKDHSINNLRGVDMARIDFFTVPAHANRIIQIPYSKPLYGINVDLSAEASKSISELFNGETGSDIPEDTVRITVLNNSENMLYWNPNGTATVENFPITRYASVILEGKLVDILKSNFYSNSIVNIGIIVETLQE